METKQPKPVILLVDDNEEILAFISEDLSECYQVLTAFDGRDALDILRRQQVQLVISDIMMPEIDGFELCKQIKSNFDYSHVPVILLTAKNTLQSRIEGLEVGADAYIEKPFSPEHLQVQVANLLANRAKLMRYFASRPLADVKSMAHTKADEEFLEQVNALIQRELTNPDMDVEQMARRLFVSRPTLYRKIKALTDLTPYELINLTRLKKAAELLNARQYKMYEIAEMVGYSSQNQFGRNFLKQFGVSPTAYLEQSPTA